MKCKLSYEGDLFEENETMKTIMHSFDLASAIIDAREIIRTRLKWGEGVSDQEEKILEEIRDALYVEGINL